MSKPGLQNISTSQTFQAWLERTNEIVDIIKEDAITASSFGDTTGSLASPLTATLIGDFTANTISAVDEIISNRLTPFFGTNTFTINASVFAESPIQNAATFRSNLGGRTSYSSLSNTWQLGFENTSTNAFIIDNGLGTTKFKITPTGNVTVAGGVTSTQFTGPLTGNVIGDVTGDLTGDVTGDVTGNLVGNVTGNVTGQVSNISNHTTTSLNEGNNLYFTTARARDSLSSGTGVSYNSTSGVIAIGQAVETSSAVTFGAASIAGNLSVNTGTGTGTGIIFSDSGDMVDLNDNFLSMRFEAGVGIYSGNKTGIRVISLNSGGSITATGDITAFASSSDVRKKENIVKIDNALEKVSKISGYTYNFIGDETKLTGVIAQELEKVLPEVVYEIDDEAFGEKTKAVRYGNIVGLLIEAIKELKAEIEELKNDN